MVACKWCVPSASDVFMSKNDNSVGENPRGFRSSGIWFLFLRIWFLSCVITCSDFYPLSNQINLFMVINIWGIIYISYLAPAHVCVCPKPGSRFQTSYVVVIFMFNVLKWEEIVPFVDIGEIVAIDHHFLNFLFIIILTETFYTNPQYRVTVTDPDDDEDDLCTILVGCLQKDRRKKRKEGLDMLTIGYVIYKVSL